MCRTPLKRKTALRRKSAMPRRSRKRSTAAEKRHMARVAAKGCIVCKAPCEVHHVTAHSDRMGRISRSNRRVIGLCPKHHRCGAVGGAKASVEALNHRGFFERYGIDLLAEADRLWLESEELER